MTKTDDQTNLQGWMRDHSDLLAISFSSSRRIEHNVTKEKVESIRFLIPYRICFQLEHQLSLRSL